MKIVPPVVDYRKLRLNNLNTEEFRHLKLLLFWPIYGFLFLFVERIYVVDYYYPMHCPLDDLIPFNEFFLIPYLFWFVYLVGIHVYTLLYDLDAFRRMMKYIIFTYSITILIYLVFPTCQELRPVRFERDNLLTRFLAGFYQFDTNTNVCPSIHVIGSLAVMEAALYTKTIRSRVWKWGFVIAATLICVSTVFLKQHSVLDLLAALPLCLVAHFLFYRKAVPCGK
ncbi:MAG: phosphatase PAP2 family protein [Candidatus Faecousia sp.]|nr:phosphatase PAP2 family protein [Candidatus Faecousia sp.]